MTEEQNKLADRLEAMLDQVGHPDYSLKEFYDGLKLIVWELRQEREPATEAVLVPEGEERWLIEGTAYYPTRRCFWTGCFWADDYLASEPPALKAARYWSKHDAEAVIPTIKSLSTDSVHNIEACGHMFQCGISPDRALKGKGASQGDPHDELVFDGQGDPEGPGAPKPSGDFVRVPLATLDRIMRDCEHGSRIWKECDALAREYRLSADEQKG